jgi:hypothetical protein
MMIANSVLEAYQQAILGGKRYFGMVMYPEELQSLDNLGLKYETEPKDDRQVYVRITIPPA